MFISYVKYIDLMSSLDEYSNCTLEKFKLQNAIFDHYMKSHRSFTAENIHGSKVLFTAYGDTKGDRYKRERKRFRNFMN